MAQTVFKQIGWFFLLVALQALMFDNIHIAGYATPMPYIYFLLILPSDMPRAGLMLWSFFLGLIVDIFACTPGVSAAAMTFAAFVRPTFLKVLSPTEKEEESFEPSSATLKWSTFMTYATLITLIHQTLFFILEAFSFFNWEDLLLNLGGSLVLTLLVIAALEGIRNGNSGRSHK